MFHSRSISIFCIASSRCICKKIEFSLYLQWTYNFSVWLHQQWCTCRDGKEEEIQSPGSEKQLIMATVRNEQLLPSSCDLLEFLRYTHRMSDLFRRSHISVDAAPTLCASRFSAKLKASSVLHLLFNTFTSDDAHCEDKGTHGTRRTKPD